MELERNQMKNDLLNILKDTCRLGIQKGAGEIEVFGVKRKKVSALAQHNDIEIAEVSNYSGLGIRVFIKKSLGFSSVNHLSKGRIESALESAIALARSGIEDRFNELPAPVKCKSIKQLYDNEAEGISIRDAINYALKIVETAQGFDHRVAVDRGYFNATIEECGIATSTGIELSEKATSFYYEIWGMAVEGNEVSSRDSESGGARFIKDINVEEPSLNFARSVVGALGAKKGRTFIGQVILTPDAVNELILEPIIHSVNALNVQRGSSSFVGKIGKCIASKEFTLIEDSSVEKGFMSRSFDREGIPPERIEIIRSGNLYSFLYNTYAGKKENRMSTGHAHGNERGVPDIGAGNIFIEPGKIGKDNLIKDIKEGVLVKRFSGFPNPVTGEFSGVVKCGAYIRNGESHPLIGTMIKGNIYHLLFKISGISMERKMIDGCRLLPYMRLEDVSIISA